MIVDAEEELSNPGNGEERIPAVTPSDSALRWLIGIRLVVVSTLFLGILLVQVYTQQLLQLKDFYGLILLAYGLSLFGLLLLYTALSNRVQTGVQLLGDIAVVTGFVWATGGLYSHFSFLYVAVIVVAGVLLRGGGLVFAGLSAIAYGTLVDLMMFGVIDLPPSLADLRYPVTAERVMYQLIIHVVGFALIAILVSFLTESLRTAHHRLEAETARSKQLRAVTDHVVRSVGSGLVATDLEGRILHVNPAAMRILALADEGSWLTRPVDEILPLAGQQWGLLRARSRTRPVRIDCELTNGMRIGLTTGPLRDDRETLVGFIVNFQDRSQVELEAERERLQERMAAAGEMAARMAHEIKNPLASISGSAQVLASVDSVDETGRRLLSIIVDESRRLSTILDDFLSSARSPGGRTSPCDLAVLLRDCVDLLKRSPETRGEHSIRLEIPDVLVVSGKEHLLRQVFWNLSRNSLQAMPEGGELTIWGERRDGAVVLEWRDQGHGMPAEVRRRAFEPFVTGRPRGTGLGLTMVYRAVEEHGGSVEITSTPGRGTVVTVELPEGDER